MQRKDWKPINVMSLTPAMLDLYVRYVGAYVEASALEEQLVMAANQDADTRNPGGVNGMKFVFKAKKGELFYSMQKKKGPRGRPRKPRLQAMPTQRRPLCVVWHGHLADNDPRQRTMSFEWAPSADGKYLERLMKGGSRLQCKRVSAA